jgi:hypothetical protein
MQSPDQLGDSDPTTKMPPTNDTRRIFDLSDRIAVVTGVFRQRTGNRLSACRGKSRDLGSPERGRRGHERGNPRVRRSIALFNGRCAGRQLSTTLPWGVSDTQTTWSELLPGLPAMRLTSSRELSCRSMAVFRRMAGFKERGNVIPSQKAARLASGHVAIPFTPILLNNFYVSPSSARTVRS